MNGRQERNESDNIKWLRWVALVPAAVIAVCAVLVRSRVVQSEESRMLTAYALVLAMMLVVAIVMAYVVIRLQISSNQAARDRAIKQ